VVVVVVVPVVVAGRALAEVHGAVEGHRPVDDPAILEERFESLEPAPV